MHGGTGGTYCVIPCAFFVVGLFCYLYHFNHFDKFICQIWSWWFRFALFSRESNLNIFKKKCKQSICCNRRTFHRCHFILSDLWPNYDFKSLIWFSNNQKKNYTSFHFHNCVWLDVLNENVCIWDHSFSWHGHSTKESNKTRIKNETTSKHLFAIISDSVYIHHICKKFTTFLNRQMKQTFVRPSFANGFLFFSLHRSFKTMIEWFRGFGPACPFNSSYTIK